MRPLMPSTALIDRRRTTEVPALARMSVSAAGNGKETSIPGFVLDRLADLALLHGIPFEYLVPNASLLPPESIRFFRLEPGWIEALHEGVLSVGEHSSADVALRKASGIPAVASRQARVRERRRGQVADAASAAPFAAGAGAPADEAVTGFLLRSAVVTNYPGLQVRAYGTTDRSAAPLPLRRIDRPSQGVLLALFGGEIAAVAIEEPHHGIRLGVDRTETDACVLQLRGLDGKLVSPPATVEVPFRSGSAAGVVDVAELARRIGQSGAGGIPSAMSSSLLGLQLLQPPISQRFERNMP